MLATIFSGIQCWIFYLQNGKCAFLSHHLKDKSIIYVLHVKFAGQLIVNKIPVSNNNGSFLLRDVTDEVLRVIVCQS